VARFDNRQAQIAGGVFGAVICVIGLGGLTTGQLEGVIWLLVGAYTIVRSLRSSLVLIDDSSVVTRSMVRTRRYVLSELRGVEVAVGRTGFVHFGREYLVFQRADGQDVGFKELSCRPPKEPDGSSVVRRAAAAINGRLPRP
jgi:hypothetical protein